MYVNKYFKILLYLLLLVILPVAADTLYNHTVRKKRQLQAKYIALKTANDNSKSLVIFNSNNTGVLIENNNVTSFDGNIFDILNDMKTNSCVVLLSFVLEYVNNPMEIYKLALRVSGGDLFMVNLEKNSLRSIWDYKLKRIMSKPYYNPNDKIAYIEVSNVKQYTQNFYRYIFKIFPYDQFKYYDFIKK
jgi:hypothetical protein